MDGRQLLAAVGTGAPAADKQRPSIYHYAAGGLGQPQAQQQLANLLLNESALAESLAASSMQSSLQFMDSNGCPLDPNLMGPLVRMDAHGRRLLAPFDAFKFPTSDMVFFRAVVSSCVSECKPANCSPTAPSGQPTPSSYASSLASLGLDDDETEVVEAAGGATSPAVGPATVLTSTMGPAVEASSSTTTTSTSTTGAPRLLVGGGASAAAASATLGPTTLLNDSQISAQPTTVASGTTRERSSELAEVEPGATGGGDSTTTVAGFGPPVGRPTGGPEPTEGDKLLPLTDSDSSASLAPNEPSPPLANQSNLGNETMLNSNHLLGHQLPPRRSQSLLAGGGGEGSATNVLADGQLHHLSSLATNSLLSEQQRQSISDLLLTGSEDGSLRAIFNQTEQLSHPTAASELRSKSANWTGGESLVAQNNSNSVDDLLARYIELYQAQQQQQQQVSLNARAGSELLAAANSSSPLGQSNSGARLKAAELRATAKLHKATKSQAARDKERRQALADSYLGAFQSMGKRRKRSPMELDEAEAEMVAKSSHAIQFSPLEGRHRKKASLPCELVGGPEEVAPLFTHSVVEMYHRARGGQRSNGRAKRHLAETPPGAEELVVQSIKIFDRKSAAESDIGARQGQQQVAGRLALNRRPSSRQSQWPGRPGAGEPRAPAPQAGSLGALAIFLVAMCFVFVQLSMLLVCLLDWNRRLGRQPRDAQLAGQGSLLANCERSQYCSTLSPSSAGSISLSSPVSLASALNSPTNSSAPTSPAGQLRWPAQPPEQNLQTAAQTRQWSNACWHSPATTPMGTGRLLTTITSGGGGGGRRAERSLGKLNNTIPRVYIYS